MVRRGFIFLLAVSLVIGLGSVFLAQRLKRAETTILQPLSRLNPPDQGPPATLTEEEFAELVPVQLEVPEKYARGVFAEPRNINLPLGFKISVFAAGLSRARLMALSTEGVIFVTEIDQGRVLAFPDRNGDGLADETIVFAAGLDGPHGIDSKDGAWYVAEEGGVVKLTDTDGDLASDITEVIISGLPTGGNHFTRTIRFGPDGRLYLTIGSTCNVCEEADKRRAAMMVFEADGSGGRVFASGLRNTVSFIVHPQTGELWGTDMGRDFLGDNIPPDEINIIEEGKHYGWPYCFSQQIVDPAFDNPGFCATSESPNVEIPAHSSPIGLRFYPRAGQFPRALWSNLFAAYHGSWNRRIPTGYKVVRITFDAAGRPTIADFATGWLDDKSGEAWGRPVDVLVGTDGALYVSDDRTGAIYRIWYEGN